MFIILPITQFPRPRVSQNEVAGQHVCAAWVTLAYPSGVQHTLHLHACYTTDTPKWLQVTNNMT